MSLNLQSAEENLAKAKEDMQFWENAVRLLRDPRVGGKVAADSPKNEPKPAPRPYGELKRRTLAALADWKPGGTCYSTSAIVERMEKGGYVFASKTPVISVNEALMNLQKEGLVKVGATQKGVRFWIKAEPKPNPPAGNTSL